MRIERAPGKPWKMTLALRGYASAGVPIFRAFVEGLSKAERAASTIGDVKDRDRYVAVLTAPRSSSS